MPFVELLFVPWLTGQHSVFQVINERLAPVFFVYFITETILTSSTSPSSGGVMTYWPQTGMVMLSSIPSAKVAIRFASALAILLLVLGTYSNLMVSNLSNN